jgi:hypothetical protein
MTELTVQERETAHTLPPLAGEMTVAAMGLAGTAAAQRWRGADAYDGLWFPWPRPLVGGRRRRQVLVQLHARSPLDFRPLYRRSHPLIPKALGLYGTVGLRIHRLTGDPVARALALDALDVLMDDRTAGDRAWGYHWDVQTRWSFYPAHSPNIVVTATSAMALHEAGRWTGRDDMRARARAAAEWVLEQLYLPDEEMFVYHPGTRVLIHNANLLGAALVHEVLGADSAAREAVSRSVARTLAQQSPDGSWPYGEGGNLGWVDSFHSANVLDSLCRVSGVGRGVAEALQRGARHYERFFDASGRARLWADRPYPEDAHSAGTGMSALATLMERGLASRELLERVARRTLRANLRDGHAVYRRYRWLRTRVHYIRWADAHVALGLADGATALAAGRQRLVRVV